MTENEKVNAQPVQLPITMYLMMFLQLLMTGYVALMLRNGVTLV